MRLSPLIGLAGLALAGAGASAAGPAAVVSGPKNNHPLPRRDYDRNDYYVLHLDSGTEPAQVGQRLGLSHEGCLGALDDHHVFSAPKSDVDLVRPVELRHRRLRRLRRRLRRRWATGVGQDGDDGGDDDSLDDSLDDADHSDPILDDPILSAIRLAQKQVLRPPWTKRGPMPAPLPSASEFYARTRPRHLQRRDDAVVAQQDSIMADLGIHDPIFKEQWHLINPIEVGNDVNVQEVWRQGVTGLNTTVAIVDDGLDMYSDDLAPNYYADGSYDFNDHGPEPRPRLADDRHGTRCAGEVSAARNDACGVGVAWDSRIAGLRILSKLITDQDESLAMMYDMQHNLIYSCSWGPPDDGRSMDAPGVLIRRAMLKAVQQGRAGLGSVYVFASGNGAGNDDNCNFDGYTNSIYSITVGAIDRKGTHPYYSEKCSAQLVVTYSSGSGDAIHTTDVGKANCYTGHGGTSAAAPLAAGILALVLQVRPDLGWRDLQYLTVDTAVPVNEDTGEYQRTSRGRRFSHTYGYGKLDSLAIVEAARRWTKVRPQAWFYSPWIHVDTAVPQGPDGVAVGLEVTAEMLAAANVAAVEHVTVTMNVDHTRRGDLSVDLVSPDGIVSHIATARKNDGAAAGYVDWTFMSVAHWGERGIGTWTIIVRDTIVNEHSGVFVDWHLKLWGEAQDPSRATLLPMPNQDDDADHTVTATITAPATTRTAPAGPTNEPPPPPAEMTAQPSDHPHRPTKIKPSGSTAPAAAPTDTALADDASEDGNGNDDDGVGSSAPSWWFSGGLSAAGRGWIYAALGLIVAFCGALGLWLWRARRARAIPRDSYEFELLNEDAEEKAGRRRPRGGELYDAFAGGSEDEEFVDGEEGEGEDSDEDNAEAELLSSGDEEGHDTRER